MARAERATRGALLHMLMLEVPARVMRAGGARRQDMRAGGAEAQARRRDGGARYDDARYARARAICARHSAQQGVDIRRELRY